MPGMTQHGPRKAHDNNQKVKLFKQLMTDIRSFSRKWHNTVISLTAYKIHVESVWRVGRWISTHMYGIAGDRHVYMLSVWRVGRWISTHMYEVAGDRHVYMLRVCGG